MFNLRRLDDAIQAMTTREQILAQYKAYTPGVYNDEYILRNADSVYFCSATVYFVVGFLVPNRMTATTICNVSSNQNATGLRLHAGTHATIAGQILASGDDYIGLLQAQNAESHTCVFASYGLTNSTRTWGFYQSNANGRGGFRRCTISDICNDRLNVGHHNRQRMSRDGFRTLMHDLTHAGSMTEMGPQQTVEWTLDVWSFRGRRILGTTSAR
jgi:hypothetical protein